MTALERLPFIQADTTGKKFWAVTPTDDYAADNATGRAYADALIAYMKETGAVNLLGSIVRSMMESRTYGGIEVGFMHRIAETVVA